MKDMGIVQGSATQAKPLVIGKDTVYVHTNIVKLEVDPEGNPTDNLYQYHEVQYGKDEYINTQIEKNSAISFFNVALFKSALDDLSAEVNTLKEV